jgi:NAD(P)-dependent dehydrogenase (short-subunit alcohol dehydrogenase family)
MSGQDEQALSGATILITGATRGIGFATAEALARQGARIIVHGRDEQRVQQACRALAQSAPRADIDGFVADLGSLADVRRLAAEVEANYERLDVLINNAGLLTRQRQETADGIERQFAVNHLAPFLLTTQLLAKLKASSPARIVTVASMAHRRAALDLNDLNWERRRYNGITAYGATKLANILFTRELARRLEDTGVTANCLHPGVVATNLFAGMGIPGSVFGALTKPFLRSATDGARTSIYLAAAEEVRGQSGLFFSNSHPVEPSAAARDASTALSLWQISERLVAVRQKWGQSPF